MVRAKNVWDYPFTKKKKKNIFHKNDVNNQHLQEGACVLQISLYKTEKWERICYYSHYFSFFLNISFRLTDFLDLYIRSQNKDKWTPS